MVVGRTNTLRLAELNVRRNLGHDAVIKLVYLMTQELPASAVLITQHSNLHPSFKPVMIAFLFQPKASLWVPTEPGLFPRVQFT